MSILIQRAILSVILGLTVSRAQEMCACPEVYNPVCCTDGFTYENQYCIECINEHPDFPGPELEVVFEGFCTEGYECITPPVFEPVCGSDGRTYTNQGALTCHNGDPTTNEEVTVWFEGICPSAECVIPAIFAPVCASDGNTYDNEFVVYCINEANPNHQIEIVSFDPCEE